MTEDKKLDTVSEQDAIAAPFLKDLEFSSSWNEVAGEVEPIGALEASRVYSVEVPTYHREGDVFFTIEKQELGEGAACDYEFIDISEVLNKCKEKLCEIWNNEEVTSFKLRGNIGTDWYKITIRWSGANKYSEVCDSFTRGSRYLNNLGFKCLSKNTFIGYARALKREPEMLF